MSQIVSLIRRVGIIESENRKGQFIEVGMAIINGVTSDGLEDFSPELRRSTRLVEEKDYSA